MKNNLYLLLPVILFATVYARAQTTEPPVYMMPNTPSVSKLIELIDHQVDYRNGTVATEIPLFEIQLKELTIPLKLVYTTSGFKPNEISDVGVGWSLVAVPTIGRQVNGLPDEIYYNTRHFKRFSAWTLEERACAAGYDYRIDGEPDQFFYSLPSRSGSFFIKREFGNENVHGFVTVPYEPILINANESLSRLTINDTDGTQYIFKGREGTTRYFRVQNSSFTSLYCADTIKTRYNEVVGFKYDGSVRRSVSQKTNGQTGWMEIVQPLRGPTNIIRHDPFGYVQPASLAKNPLASESYYYHLPKYFLLNDDGYTKWIDYYYIRQASSNHPNTLDEMYTKRAGTNYSAAQTSGLQYCNGITFPEGSVEFKWKELSATEQKHVVLEQIIVKDKNGAQIRKIILNTSLVSQRRPVLNSVSFYGSNNALLYKYDMEYYPDTALGPTSVTTVHTFHTNPWGYYQMRGEKMQELYDMEFYNFRLFKVYSSQANESYMKFRPGNVSSKDYYYKQEEHAKQQWLMLKSIVNPLKGRTEFEYEPAKFYHPDRQQIVYTGAQRIKTITETADSDGSKRVRRFEYGTNGLGLPTQILTSRDFMTSYKIKDYVYTASSASGLGSYWYDFNRYKVEYHSNPILDNTVRSVAGIVNDIVTEFISDGSNNNYGKVEYRYDYDNIDGIRDVRVWEDRDSGHPILRPLFERYYRGWKVGQLKSVKTYRWDSNNIYSLANSIDYYYDVKEVDRTARMYIYPWEKHIFHNVPGGVTELALCTGQSGSQGVRENFIDKTNFIVSGNKLLVKEVETEYPRWSPSVTKTTLYKYNTKMQLSEVTTTNSDGSIVKQENQYSSDLQGSVYTQMISKNFIDPVINTKHYTNNELILTNSNTYKVSSGMIVPDYIETSYGNGVSSRDITFDLYDSYGNVRQVTEKGYLKTTILWGYGGRYPVVFIQGMSYTDVVNKSTGINISSLLNQHSDAQILTIGSQLRQKLNGEALVYVYTYKPFAGVSSIVDPRGAATTFTYNNNNQLSAVRDENGNLVEAYDYNLINK